MRGELTFFRGAGGRSSVGPAVGCVYLDDAVDTLTCARFAGAAAAPGQQLLHETAAEEQVDPGIAATVEASEEKTDDKRRVCKENMKKR